LSPADQALFVAVLRGEHRLRGFRNQDLAKQLYRNETKDVAERRRRSQRVTRLIHLLRAHGLVAKTPRSRRYRVTPQGDLLMSAAIYVRHHYLPRQLRAAS
jgi:DNA-binding IclR family transcriptional regulator